jgi:hypothetical protein
MMITITEHVADVAQELDAAHGQVVFSLDPADANRSHLGHAIVRVAAPVARYEGLAIAVGDAAIVGVPDPVRILIRDESGPNPVGPSLVIRRKALPVLVKVETSDSRAWVLRRLAGRHESWFSPQTVGVAAENLDDKLVVSEGPPPHAAGTSDEE